MREQTKIAVTSSPNPSLVTQAVTFTARVGDGSAPIPTGAVTFRIRKENVTSGVTLELGPVSVDENGEAKVTTNALEEWTYLVTARYSGDASHTWDDTSIGANPLRHEVKGARIDVSLESSQNPAPEGTPITFTATLTVPGGITAPDGLAVHFYQMDPSYIDLGVVPVSRDTNTARLTTAALAAGQRLIVATPVNISDTVRLGSGSVYQIIDRVGASGDDAIRVTRGALRFDRRTQKWLQPVTLVNVGPNAAEAPISLILKGLEPGVQLLNATGVTRVTYPRGSPYLDAGRLPPGGQVTLILQFSKTGDESIRYETSVLIGPGLR